MQNCHSQIQICKGVINFIFRAIQSIVGVVNIRKTPKLLVKDIISPLPTLSLDKCVLNNQTKILF